MACFTKEIVKKPDSVNIQLKNVYLYLIKCYLITIVLHFCKPTIFVIKKLALNWDNLSSTSVEQPYQKHAAFLFERPNQTQYKQAS